MVATVRGITSTPVSSHRPAQFFAHSEYEGGCCRYVTEWPAQRSFVHHGRLDAAHAAGSVLPLKG